MDLDCCYSSETEFCIFIQVLIVYTAAGKVWALACVFKAREDNTHIDAG